MKVLLAALFILNALAGCGPNPRIPAQPMSVGKAGQNLAKEVTFKASDGVTVYGDLYTAPKGHSEKVVLMFHQAGSNAGEYASIAPKVSSWGFDCLATDQRSGGGMWGRDNRTMKAASGEYMDAYKDLLGAVDWAKGKGYKQIIAWGSSYSAALTFRLLSERPQVEAALVFSPGEYFDQKGLVSGWAAKDRKPVYFVCTPDELPDGRQAIFDAIPHATKSVLDVVDGAVHGSSTLLPEKAPTATPHYWKGVEDFLKRSV